jgi:crotonobetaine/carnitine-CoA ligase
VIVSVPEVAEAAVIPVKDDVRGEEIKACIVLRAPRPDVAEVLPRLIEHCQRSLAAFKVPRYFAFLDAFPKTASEKIAKAQLIQQSQSSRQPSYDRVAGRWL